ncbi:MAG: energy transducer TonB [Panacagrimonas sp.]
MVIRSFTRIDHSTDPGAWRVASSRPNRYAGLTATIALHVLLLLWLLWPSSDPLESSDAAKPGVTQIALLPAPASSRQLPSLPPPPTNPNVAPMRIVDLMPILNVEAEPVATSASELPSAAPSDAMASPSPSQHAQGTVIAATCMPLQWLQMMSRMISFQQQYPAQSRQLGEQGTATVRVSVARDGRVLEAPLLRGTGYSALDREAREVILRIGRFAPIPKDACRGARIIVIDQPVGFRPRG